jgi:hypothetical protein
MGSLPGMTVGMGATEAVAALRMAVGSMIILTANYADANRYRMYSSDGTKRLIQPDREIQWIRMFDGSGREMGRGGGKLPKTEGDQR